MPVRGPKPKPRGQVQHRGKPDVEWREVINVPYQGESPDLPELTAHGEEWTQFAQTWWATVRTMPHCILWSESDWLFAIATADLVSAYRSHAPEIRMREKSLGTTDDARIGLRIRYVDASGDEGDAGAKVTNLSDYRDL